MDFDKNLLLPLLKDGNERVGFVLKTGEIIEVDNVCHDPVNGFEVSGEDLIKFEDTAAATWHTHPGQGSNLTFGDHESFLNYPALAHYIVGTDGASLYEIKNGKVIIA